MKQEQFVARYQAEWQAFEHWLETREDLRKALSERNLVKSVTKTSPHAIAACASNSRLPASAATARW